MTDFADQDPTLADCCLRDLKEQAYVNRVKRCLLEHDVTSLRLNLAHCAFVREPAGLDQVDRNSLLIDSDEGDQGRIWCSWRA